MKPENDEVNLIDQARTSPDAFGQLYQKYVEKIYNYIYYRTGNTHDAEDLTARVFFKALKGIASYRHMGLPFSAWLYRIAHNMVANFHRDGNRIKEISLDDYPLQNLSGKVDLTETVVQKSQEIDKLMGIIRELPRIRQELIILKFVDKLSNAEIGLILRKSEGAVKSLYHRTLMELREQVKLYFDESDLSQR